MLIALLLGAVLQSWGQKFPGVLPGIPNVGFELPKLSSCGLFPAGMTKPGYCATGRHTLESFAEALCSFKGVGNMRTVVVTDTPHQAQGVQLTIEANSLAELVCKAAKAYGVSVEVALSPGGTIITFRQMPGDKGTGL